MSNINKDKYTEFSGIEFNIILMTLNAESQGNDKYSKLFRKLQSEAKRHRFGLNPKQALVIMNELKYRKQTLSSMASTIPILKLANIDSTIGKLSQIAYDQTNPIGMSNLISHEVQVAEHDSPRKAMDDMFKDVSINTETVQQKSHSMLSGFALASINSSSFGNKSIYILQAVIIGCSHAIANSNNSLLRSQQSKRLTRLRNAQRKGLKYVTCTFGNDHLTSVNSVSVNDVKLIARRMKELVRKNTKQA